MRYNDCKATYTESKEKEACKDSIENRLREVIASYFVYVDWSICIEYCIYIADMSIQYILYNDYKQIHYVYELIYYIHNIIT